MNKLPSSMIGGKTLLKFWSGGAAQDYDLLRVSSPTFVQRR